MTSNKQGANKIELFCRRKVLDDKYVGEVNLTLCEKSCKEVCTSTVDMSGSNKSSCFGTLKYSRVLVPETSSSVDYDRIIELLKAGASLLNAMATVFN